jgi:hypothetical protein
MISIVLMVSVPDTFLDSAGKRSSCKRMRWVRMGYTGQERLKLMGAIVAVAAKECQIVIFTCVPERYAFIGEAAVVPL